MKTIRIEMDEGTVITAIVTAAIIALLVRSIVVEINETQRTKAAFINGYEQSVLPGSTQPKWVRIWD